MNGLNNRYLLSEEAAIKQQMETLGLSQVSDALVIVVSEEKGWISMALQGQLYPNLGTFAFLEKPGGSMEDGAR